MKKIFIAAAVIISSQTFAQDPSVKDSSKNLEPVIITANKVLQKQVETGKVLSIISRAELEMSAGKSLGEVLNQQVGLSIGGANNTLGSNQTIFMRGAAAANTLLLMDGIPLYDPSGISSEFDLNSFSIDHIERIEIIKGAQSTLYGSDAVAGVINIITQKPAEGKTKVAGNLSAGSYKMVRGGVNVSGTAGKVDYFAGYSKIVSDGFSSAYDSTERNDFEKDGFKQDALNIGFGFIPVQKMFVRVYGKYNTNRAQIDAGRFTDDKDYNYRTFNTTAGTIVHYQLKNAAIHLNYNYNAYNRKYVNDSADIGGYSPGGFYSKYIHEKYEGHSHFAEVYTNAQISGELNIVGGVDYRTSATNQKYFSISSFGPYTSPAIDNDSAHVSQYSVYASMLYTNNNGFNAGVGGRYNHHSIYGSNGTFSFNPSLLLSDRLKIFANISSGYRVPSLYQLFSEFGNRKLKPERSGTYEAGIQYNRNLFSARAVAFKRDTKDVFVFYTDYNTYVSKYINEDRQKDHGFELEATGTVKEKLFLSANYSYVEGKLFTKDIAGKDTSFNNLYRRPKNSFNLTVGYKMCDDLFFRVHLKTVSDLYEPQFMAAPVKLNGYYTIDFYGQYQFNKKIKLFTDLQNITDQVYFDQQGFSTRRFNISAGISFSFTD